MNDITKMSNEEITKFINKSSNKTIKLYLIYLVKQFKKDYIYEGEL